MDPLTLAIVAGVLLLVVLGNGQIIAGLPSFDTPEDLGVQHDSTVITGTGDTNLVTDLALAIADAEGYNVPGSIPQRANNPGDLFLGDIGYGTLGQGVTVFRSAADGWAALHRQINLMVTGTSRVYTSPSWSLQRIANKWTATDPGPWAANVAGYLSANGYPGTSPDSQVLLYG